MLAVGGHGILASDPAHLRATGICGPRIANPFMAAACVAARLGKVEQGLTREAAAGMPRCGRAQGSEFSWGRDRRFLAVSAMKRGMRKEGCRSTDRHRARPPDHIRLLRFGGRGAGRRIRSEAGVEGSTRLAWPWPSPSPLPLRPARLR